MKAKASNSSPGQTPIFSVIIPTYQRLEGLRNCLSGIAGINTDRDDFEVIVVDDGSDSDPSSVVAQFEPDLHIRLHRQPFNQGPAAARNQGAALARGDQLVFIDDDCIPSHDWLDRLKHHVGHHGGKAIGGNCHNGLGDSIWSEAQQMLLDYLNGYYNRDPEQARFCPTNNLLVPRKAFLDLGGFDTSFPFAAGGDRDFSDRWIRSGAGLCFITDAPVYHQHSMGFTEFLRLHYRYGRGARRFRTRKANHDGRRKFEPVGFYGGLVLYPYSRTGPLRATVLAMLQLVSQAAHTLGYTVERFKPS